MFQDGLAHEVCASITFFATVSDTQDRFCHVYHMELLSFQLISDFPPDLSLSVLWECSFFRPRLEIGLNHPAAQERVLQANWSTR